ncbi:MAG: drug/metabolite transporter (DMT)-like permease [Paracoccaceae bacterium]|jgi:drug/metabolite transporter (DMT)-like permease
MRPLRGIAYKLVSVVIFIAMVSMIKATAPRVPSGEAVFFRSFFALPVILMWLYHLQELRHGLRVNNPWGHAKRGVLGAVAMLFSFAGLGYLPLPEVTAIAYLAPLLTVVFAAIILGEEVRIFRISAVGLGLVGVTIVVWPKLTFLSPEVAMKAGDPEALGVALVMLGATFAALAHIFVRKLVQTDKTPAIVFYFSVTSIALSLLTIPFGWVVPTPFEAALLVCSGLLGGLGQIFLTAGYREADASVVAPFDYTSMIFALLIGYFIFAEVPSLTTMAGAGLVIFAGILIIWREGRLEIERTKQRRAVES